MACIDAENYDPNVHKILGTYSSLSDCQNDCSQSSTFIGDIGNEIIQELKAKGIDVPEMWS